MRQIGTSRPELRDCVPHFMKALDYARRRFSISLRFAHPLPIIQRAPEHLEVHLQIAELCEGPTLMFPKESRQRLQEVRVKNIQGK